jgi:hypothetical protein
MSDYSSLGQLAIFGSLLLAACTTYDPLYCDGSQSCRDPARPFCDLAGEYPASDGVARTCIPSPFDAGGEHDGGSGSATDGGPGNDAGSKVDAGSRCTWTQLSKLANVNATGVGESLGSLNSGGRDLVFGRDEEAKNVFYVASRATAGEAFGEPSPLPVASGENGVFPELSASGLELFYSAGVIGQIQTATRSSPTGSFGASEGTGLDGGSAALSGDELAIYFLGDGLVVQRATREAIGEPWGPPETVLPTTGFSSVDVSPDELRLLVTYNLLLLPPFPIGIAERDSTDDPFGPPIAINEGFLLPDAAPFAAKWDASQTQMVVSANRVDQMDLYYSVCK